MILVDTTVVIDYVRGKDATLNVRLPTVAPGICGIVRAELLCGARDARHRATLEALLATFLHVPISEALWDTIGDNLRTLRLRGITVPFADVAIATLAIANSVELWQRDHHFLDIQRVLPALRLYQEPP